MFMKWDAPNMDSIIKLMRHENYQVSQFNSESANWNMYFEAFTWETIDQFIWIFSTSQNFVLDVLLFLVFVTGKEINKKSYQEDVQS